MPTIISVPVNPLTRDLLFAYYAPSLKFTDVREAILPIENAYLRSIYALALDHLPYGQPILRDSPKGKVEVKLRVPPKLEKYALMKRHLGRIGRTLDEHINAVSENYMVGMAIYSSAHHAGNLFIRLHNLDARYEDRLVRATARAMEQLPLTMKGMIPEYVT